MTNEHEGEVARRPPPPGIRYLLNLGLPTAAELGRRPLDRPGLGQDALEDSPSAGIDLGEVSADRAEHVALGPVTSTHRALVMLVGVDRLDDSVASTGPRLNPGVVAVEALELVALPLSQRH